MQAVILAAGKSTRTMPLTQTRPKPLLTILNRPLLEYNLDQLDRLVDEVILIVGYRKEMIMEYFGDHYKSMKLTYVEQTEQLGTGHAVQQVKGHITGRFLVINGDDLYARQDFEELLKHDAALLVKEVEHAERWGIVEPDGDKVKRLVEKPKDPPSNLGNIGAYVFDKTLFNLQIDKSERGEYEITDYVTLLASQESSGML